MDNSQLQFPKTALSDGTSVLATPTNPVRVDPTGTTVQPVSVVAGGSVGVGSINSTSQVSVANTATQIIAANANRAAVLIVNTSSTTIIYLGKDNTVTTANGYPLLPNVGVTIPVTAAVWGIVAGANLTAGVMELQ